MSLAPSVRIDLDALRHNLNAVRHAAPVRKVMAIIKADAYGHGLLPAAQALTDADALGVARLDEAVRLRDAGITAPIVLLEGFQGAAELREAVARDLTLVIHQTEQIDVLAQAALPKAPPCWLKLDTGMHRLGVDLSQAESAYQRLSGLCAGRPGLMTHLANADDRADPATDEQLARFLPIAAKLHAHTSIANSAGILGFTESHGDWVRPGLMLYGSSPFNQGTGQDLGLRPVMTLSANLIAVRALKAGDAVGYGGVWQCPKAMLIGVVGIGYGDGYPREIALDTPVLVNGKQSRVVGRVSMDMLTVDLSDQAQAKIGDPVILWGAGLAVERVAQAAGTIPYTLLCGIKSRVRRQLVQATPEPNEVLA